MSGQNRLIQSVFQKGSESALSKALLNANEVAAEESGESESEKKKESIKGEE